jgi:YD repeat-containing protein
MATAISWRTRFSNTDSTPLATDVTSAPNHDSAAGTSSTIRGNLTETDHWLNTTGAYLATINTYDILGHLRSTQDPDGNTTSFSYNDSWSGATCPYAGSNTYAYLTKTTNAKGQVAQSQYFLCTGLAEAHQDQNDINAGNSGTTFTYDGMNRPSATSFPDGGSVTSDYSDNHSTAPPLWASSSTLINASTGLSTTRVSVLDGLGRVQQHKSSVPAAQCNSGYTYQDFTYDALGRSSTTSNPYCTTSDPTYGLITNAYDALGRVTQITKQDGSISTVSYTGNCATATDEAGKSRKSCSDALGRLVNVWEDPSGLNYETDYQYDALGNLLKVTQNGSNPANARIRTFTYDSLSRLLAANNPESGQICYGTVNASGQCQNNGYDGNGNVLYKTSPAPNAPAGSTATQTISYCYDALNRVTGKAYSAQTCTNGQLPAGTAVVSYTYDQGTNGIGHLTSLTDQAGSGSYSYDVMGRTASESRSLAGITKSMSYTYDLDGSLNTLTYPSGAVITYTPDSAGHHVSAVDNVNNINYVTGSGGPNPSSGATYGPDGSILSFNQGWTTSFAGIANSFSYNSRLQPVNMAAVSPGTTGTSATTTVTIGGSLQMAASSSGSPAPNAGVGSPLSGYIDASGTQHFVYFSGNQHIDQFFYNGSAWGTTTALRGQVVRWRREAH